MSSEDQPLTDPELDHQLMELLTLDEFTMQYMVAYEVVRSEKAANIAVYDASEDVPFAQAHAVKLRDYLRSGEGMDKLTSLRQQVSSDPEAMYDWMYGYFFELLSTDEEE